MFEQGSEANVTWGHVNTHKSVQGRSYRSTVAVRQKSTWHVWETARRPKAGDEIAGDMEVVIRELTRGQIVTHHWRPSEGFWDFIPLKWKGLGGFECRTDVLKRSLLHVWNMSIAWTVLWWTRCPFVPVYDDNAHTQPGVLSCLWGKVSFNYCSTEWYASCDEMPRTMQCLKDLLLPTRVFSWSL